MNRLLPAGLVATLVHALLLAGSGQMRQPRLDRTGPVVIQLTASLAASPAGRPKPASPAGVRPRPQPAPARKPAKPAPLPPRKAAPSQPARPQPAPSREKVSPPSLPPAPPARKTSKSLPPPPATPTQPLANQQPTQPIPTSPLPSPGPAAPCQDGPRQPATASRPAAPRYRQNRPPRYPALARRLGLEGTVVFSVLVDEQGKVVELGVLKSSGHRILDRAARRAVRRWQFSPALARGRPIPARVEIPVRFVLR